MAMLNDKSDATSIHFDTAQLTQYKLSGHTDHILLCCN